MDKFAGGKAVASTHITNFSICINTLCVTLDFW